MHELHPVWGRFGRCIGPGGFPAYRGELGDYEQVEGGHWRSLPARNLVPGGLCSTCRTSSFRVTLSPTWPTAGQLEIDGPSVIEQVHDPRGKVLLTTQLA
jgi:hypothetical protein